MIAHLRSGPIGSFPPSTSSIDDQGPTPTASESGSGGYGVRGLATQDVGNISSSLSPGVNRDHFYCDVGKIHALCRGPGKGSGYGFQMRQTGVADGSCKALGKS